MTREEIFNEDRKERDYYIAAEYESEIFLPLTKDGFEALVEEICKCDNLPFDDAMRAVIAGYIHHIPNEINTTTLEKLSKVAYKAIANSTSWRIDQEIKIKHREEIKKKEQELTDAGKENQVIPINKD